MLLLQLNMQEKLAFNEILIYSWTRVCKQIVLLLYC